jgi:hypothetical protein
VAEGLSPSEVGKEIAEHRERDGDPADDSRHDRLLTIIEAMLLAVVAVLAAYSGYAAAKWSTSSSVSLARASTVRTKANRAEGEALQLRTLDSVSFNAWFTAFIAGNARGQELATSTACVPDTGRRSMPGWPRTRRTTRTHHRAPSTCRST